MKKLFSNKYFVISFVLLLIVITVGVTYAIIAWTTTDYNVTLSTSCFDVNYKLGKDITAVLNPTDAEEAVYELQNAILINEDMAVSDISLSFKPECTRHSGIASIDLNVGSISNAFTENGNSTGSLRYFLIPYSSSEYPTVDIEHLSKHEFQYIASGSITESGNRTIFTTNLYPGETKEYIIVFLIDSNLVDTDVIGASFTASVDSSVDQYVRRIGASTPISDFLYVLGDDNNPITSLPLYVYSDCLNSGSSGGGKAAYNYEGTKVIPLETSGSSCDISNNKQIYNYTLTNSIELPSNTILLTGYTGSDTEINIPDTYTIDGVTYNVMILSNLYLNSSGDSGGGASGKGYDFVEGERKSIITPLISSGGSGSSTFCSECEIYGLLSNNSTLEEVSIGDNVEVLSIDKKGGVNIAIMEETFYNDISLRTVSNLPNKLTIIVGAFNRTSVEGTIRINSCDLEEFGDKIYDNNLTIEVPAHSKTACVVGNYVNHTSNSCSSSGGGGIKGGGTETKGYDFAIGERKSIFTPLAMNYGDNLKVVEFENDYCTFSGGSGGSGR